MCHEQGDRQNIEKAAKDAIVGGWRAQRWLCRPSDG